ncbi:hypothetical protein [Lederbergia lenta]|uniref:hypothetical protein n=1 Tax=Lederbergia lenta TaxID=1467 RepID=UPI00203B6E8B|nr:hypothetical protein [Lederbergia lenta]MCM3110004.1 hypothetical protein [Lederbergia lenta]
MTYLIQQKYYISNELNKYTDHLMNRITSINETNQPHIIEINMLVTHNEFTPHIKAKILHDISTNAEKVTLHGKGSRSNVYENKTVVKEILDYTLAGAYTSFESDCSDADNETVYYYYEQLKQAGATTAQTNDYDYRCSFELSTVLEKELLCNAMLNTLKNEQASNHETNNIELIPEKTTLYFNTTDATKLSDRSWNADIHKHNLMYYQLLSSKELNSNMPLSNAAFKNLINNKYDFWLTVINSDPFYNNECYLIDLTLRYINKPITLWINKLTLNEYAYDVKSKNLP